MNIALEQFRSIEPINDETTVNKMLTILVDVPPTQQEDFWFREAGAGSVCLYENSLFPNVVLEYVQGTADDSVTTLYKPNAVFNSRQTLIEAREKLMEEIGRCLLALPSTIAVYDSGRERQVMLRELGTAQLYDVLAYFDGKSQIAI